MKIGGRGRFVVMAMILVLSEASHARCATQVRHSLENIWTQISRHVVWEAQAWPVHCLDQAGINAYVDSDRHGVYVSRAIAAWTPDELAAVLTHERAHIDLGHMHDRQQARSQAEELAADRLGAFYMRLSGYKPSASAKVLRKFARTPRDRQRIKALSISIHQAQAMVPRDLSASTDRGLSRLVRRWVRRVPIAKLSDH